MADTWTILFTVAVLRDLLGKLEQNVVVVENGGKAAVDDLGRHGSIGQ